MDNTINGRTPEEIKKGLECCNMHQCPLLECPYFNDELCGESLNTDALALIQHLESAQPKWISVEERLPGDPLDGVGDVVELLIDKGDVKEVLPGYYDHEEKDWVIYIGDISGLYLRKYFSWWSVIKWREMPEPPEEDKE